MSNNNQANQQQLILQPPLYFAEEHVWNVCFHPFSDILACSQINGQIQVLSYNSQQVKPLAQKKDLHKESARFCQFSPSGNLLASCGVDKRLSFLDGQGKTAHIIKKAHPSPINRCKFLNQNVIVSGDDDGLVKVWDLRTVTPVFHAENQSQAITGIAFDSHISDFNIYTSCENGTIAAYDLRQSSTQTNAHILCLSDSVDEDLQGIQIVKNGSYIVAPSSEGSVYIFKREQLEHYVDKIQGQPGSVDAIIKIDENTIVSGCEDGFLRGLSIFPNKILQVLGQHQQEQNFGIQSLSLSHCRRFAASSSHDNSIKFYDVNDFIKNRSNHKQDISQQLKQQMERHISSDQSQMNWEVKEEQNSEDFEDEDSDDDDDSQIQEVEPQKKKKKNNRMSMKARQKQLKKENSKSFFKGL